MNKNLNGWVIAPEVYNWIRKNIEDGSTILELGSGTGTIELCKDYTVYSIEHDKRWLDKTPTNYIYAPIKIQNGLKWYDVDVLKKELPKSYDLLLIDGPPEAIGRLPILNNLELFDLSVPIIIDDTHRNNETKILNELNRELNRESVILKSDKKESTILI